MRWGSPRKAVTELVVHCRRAEAEDLHERSRARSAGLAVAPVLERRVRRLAQTRKAQEQAAAHQA